MASLPVVEHFQRYALERRVCRDGANPTENRVQLLGDLLLHAGPVNRALKLHGAQMDEAAAGVSQPPGFSALARSSFENGPRADEIGPDADDDEGEEDDEGSEGGEVEGPGGRSWAVARAAARAALVDGAVSKAAALHCMVLELIVTIVLEVCELARLPIHALDFALARKS